MNTKRKPGSPMTFMQAIEVVREHRDYLFAVERQGDADSTLAGDLIAALDKVQQHAIDRFGIRMNEAEPVALDQVSLEVIVESPNFREYEKAMAAEILRLRAPQKRVANLNKGSVDRCSDCPPAGYPTDKTRCATCPRRCDCKGETDLADHQPWCASLPNNQESVK
jgi:hypothetical protein